MPRRTHSETVESLVNLVLQSVRFRSRESLIYSRIPWHDGHQSVLLHDEVGRAWLAAQYLDICHEPPSQSALTQAIATATSLSLIGAQKVDCPLRVHWDGNPRRPRAIYLDRRTNGEIVEITAAGYRVTYEHLLDFRATFHEETLPAPEAPVGPVNALTSLRGLLNLTEDRAWIRCLLWLLAAFRPAGPYPPLVLQGPAASGKSIAARMLRALVDPNQMSLRAVPRSPSALAELAWRNHVLAFDDVQRVPPVAESNLARLASGGAFEFRDPHLKSPLAFAAARPLLFTTRNPRLDLGGRAIQIELPDIPPQHRRAEADLFDEFETLRPQLGAVLYAALSAAIANFDRVSAPALPRHADAALWLIAAASSIGLTAHEVLAALGDDDDGPRPGSPGESATPSPDGHACSRSWSLPPAELQKQPADLAKMSAGHGFLHPASLLCMMLLIGAAGLARPSAPNLTVVARTSSKPIPEARAASPVPRAGATSAAASLPAPEWYNFGNSDRDDPMLKSVCLPAVAAVHFVCATAAADDRAVAEWVLRAGGSVTLEGASSPMHDVAALPSGPVRLRAVNVVSIVVSPTDLERLEPLTHLRELYLSGRTWHSMPAETSRKSMSYFAGMTALEKLVLSLPVQTEIPLTDEAIQELAALANLRELRLAQTKIRGHAFAPFTAMRALNVNNTRFDDTGMAALASMKHLEKLYARDTQVTDEGLRHIAQLRGLTELDLYGARISDAGLVHLKELTALTRLNLLGADVTDAGLDHLSGMIELRELNLYRTKITNAGLEKLKRFRHLRALDVRYSRATGGGVAALQAAIPECRVAFLDASGGMNARQSASPPARRDPESIAAWVRNLGGTIEKDAISLASTPVTDADLEIVAAFPGLRTLDLETTQIGDLGLAKLAAAKQLTNLNLAHTTVSDAGLAHLAALTRLERLNLGYTLVRGEGLRHLKTLAALRELDLAGAAVASEELAHLQSLPRLETLNLQYSDISNPGLAHVAALTGLKSLNLTGVDVGDEGLSRIGALTNLQELMLNYGRFTDKGLASLKTLTGLTRLHLVRTRTTDAGLASLSSLSNLRELNLDYTAVTDKGLAALAPLTRLAHLKLDSAGVTDAGIESLKKLTSLESVNLYHTLVTDRGFEALKAALPDCRIVWVRESALPVRRGS